VDTTDEQRDGTGTARVVVVRRGDRPLGAFVDGPDVRWVDLRRSRTVPFLLAGTALACATAVGLRRAGHPQTIHRVSMGPGGWVSIKNGRPPEDPTRRPLWAVLLRAHRL
jgi:hypothetical protein